MAESVDPTPKNTTPVETLNSSNVEEIVAPAMPEAPLPAPPVVVETPMVNLKVLYYDLIIDQELPKELSLQTYLLALMAEIESNKDEELTQDLVKRIMVDSLSTEQPMELNPKWLEIRSAPSFEVKYQTNATAEALDAMTADDFEWEKIDFSLEVLRFQVAELEKMADNQLSNPMREFGISSPTGTPWYNFTVSDNLEAGLKALIDNKGEEMEADWSIFGLWLQYGRTHK